jgi:DUF1365 family protein
LLPGCGDNHGQPGSGVTESAFYIGKVVHRRHRPKQHKLTYRMFSMFLNLDELGVLDKTLRLFSYNRRGLFSFHDRDHGSGNGDGLSQWVRQSLADAGITGANGPVYLLCYPRIFGYVFNPLSVYYCYGKDGKLHALIYEVGNTWGEQHCYLIPADADNGMVKHSCDKVFFVSPFMPMNCRYNFRARVPGNSLSLLIRETVDDEAVLDAWFSGRKRALTDAALLGLAVRFPFMTLKVVAGIHWEALKLWLKGLPVFKHETPPAHNISLINTPSGQTGHHHK